MKVKRRCLSIPGIMKFAQHHYRDESGAGAGPGGRPVATRSIWLGVAAFLVLGFAQAQAQVSMFLRIGGAPASIGSTQSAPLIPGSSTDAQYPQWINVLSMSHGISLPVSGTSVGPSQFSDLSLMKTMDLSSPSLELLVNGSNSGLPVSMPIDNVTLDFRVGGTTPIVFYRVQLQQVFVTSYQVSGASDVPTESLSFKFARIQWTYVPYSNGKAGTPITKGWDLTKNAAF